MPHPLDSALSLKNRTSLSAVKANFPWPCWIAFKNGFASYSGGISVTGALGLISNDVNISAEGRKHSRLPTRNSLRGRIFFAFNARRL